MKKQKYVLGMSSLSFLFAQSALAVCTVNDKEVPCDQVPTGAIIGTGIFFLFFMVIGIAFFAFWVWMLIDAIKNEKDNLALWLILMFVFGPLVSVIYYFVVKRKRNKK